MCYILAASLILANKRFILSIHVLHRDPKGHVNLRKSGKLLAKAFLAVFLVLPKEQEPKKKNWDTAKRLF